jgi:hypothetical protein
MLPGHPETIKRPEIFHGNSYLVQNTAQHTGSALTLLFLGNSGLLKVPECQSKFP